MVDIARDPRWGRIVEGAGENPYLGWRWRALRCRDSRARIEPRGSRACLRQTLRRYGAAEGGRDYDSSYIPETYLRNVYLPPFKAALDAGAAP